MTCQQGTLTLPDTLFRPPFWDFLVLELLRPDSSNLQCLYSTFHLEYHLVLSRFWLLTSRNIFYTRHVKFFIGCGHIQKDVSYFHMTEQFIIRLFAKYNRILIKVCLHCWIYQDVYKPLALRNQWHTQIVLITTGFSENHLFFISVKAVYVILMLLSVRDTIPIKAFKDSTDTKNILKTQPLHVLDNIAAVVNAEWRVKIFHCLNAVRNNDIYYVLRNYVN